MSETLSYNDYTGSVEVSVEDNCLYGKILFIQDIITYEGTTVDELGKAFKDAVDHYVTYCEETGRPANKPYSGTFNVRIGKKLHRKVAKEAFVQNTSLNEFVTQCIKNVIEHKGVSNMHR